MRKKDKNSHKKYRIDLDLNTITDYEAVVDLQNDNSAITAAVSGILVEKLGDTSIFGDYA